MQCHVPGCDRIAMYETQAVCQKHYFRFMRNGTYEIVRKPRSKSLRVETPNGYVALFEPGHPLAMKNGYVYEHRKTAYESHGAGLSECAGCGKSISWATCHVDHIDFNRKNNKVHNLRPLCRGCNSRHSERQSIKKYEYGARCLSLTQWAKQPDVPVGRSALVARLRAGLSMEQALFKRNVTHPKREVYRALNKEHRA